MTDREMLELAAWAAGHEFECIDHDGRGENNQYQIRGDHGGMSDWNPLEDDGDALRLAVRLGFTVGVAKCWSGNSQIHSAMYGEDPPQGEMKATRRAIVRAAAAAAEIARARREGE